MITAVFETESKSDLDLLIKLAKKIGINTRILTQEEIEDIGLAGAINAGETGEYVDTEEFLSTLRQ